MTKHRLSSWSSLGTKLSSNSVIYREILGDSSIWKAINLLKNEI